MRTLSLLLFNFVALLLHAQTGPGGTGVLAADELSLLLEEEHRYHFTMQSDLSAPMEKELLSALAELDPRMHLNTDPAVHELKMLAYRSIDPTAVIAIAARFGVSLLAQDVVINEDAE